MYFLFIIENKGADDKRNNESLFKLVPKHNIIEENIYFDTDSEEVIYEMIDKIQSGDTLIVKRVDDLARTNRELQSILEIMEFKGIILATEEHKGLNGKKYYSALSAAQDLSDSYKEKRRIQGYKDAQIRGIVGRPQKKKELETAVRLYKTGEFTISEIEKLSLISSSTLFRYMKNQGGK